MRANLLVIRLSSLGDVVLTTPVYHSLKKAWPDCRITVLTKPAFAPVLEGHPAVDAVLPYLGFFDALGKIKAGGFTHLLDLHAKASSILLSLLSGIPERLRYDKDATARRLFVYFRRRSPSLTRHTVDRYLEPLAAWNVPAAVRVPDLEAGPGAAAVAARLRSEGLERRRLVAFHPGASWATKRWPAERYAQLAKTLAAGRGATVLLVGGKDEKALCAEIFRLAGPDGIRDWSGTTTLSELKGLMPKLSLFVTNCTGPMHIAAALGVPTAALYGPTTRELGFFPLGESVRVVEAPLACRPCTLHGDSKCPQGHFLCMRLLTADKALAACDELLESEPVA